MEKNDSDMTDVWKTLIEESFNFTFVKFGDGEIICMDGREGQNCDEHPYSKELGDKLIVAYKYFQTRDDVFIAKWTGTWGESYSRFHIDTENIRRFVSYNTLIPTPDYMPKSLEDFYRCLKQTTRKKIMVAPERLISAYEMLNVDVFIPVTLKNCFSEYDVVLKKVIDNISDYDILITSCGMMAKPLIADCIKEKNITCLDTGSAFDPLCGFHTREPQLSAEQSKEFFKELL